MTIITRDSLLQKMFAAHRRTRVLFVIFAVTAGLFASNECLALKPSSDLDVSAAQINNANAEEQVEYDAEQKQQSKDWDESEDNGAVSISAMNNQFLLAHPEVKFLRDADVRDKDGRAIPGFVNPALVKGASPVGTVYPPTPASAMGWRTESKLYEGMYMSGLNGLGGFSGQSNSDLKSYAQELQAGNFLARTLQYPSNVANQAKAQTMASANAIGNAMGDMAKGQSASAISYCSSFMRNFTTEEGNRWNQLRNGLFVPIAILLLLPGAVLTQVKAVVSAGNPALGDINPFDGILRSVVAIFLIPGTYLVVNYGIDFSNSVVTSIASSYKRVMHRSMYKDALAAQIRAFPVRTPKENQNVGKAANWPKKRIDGVESFEDQYLATKYIDTSSGTFIVPRNKTDEAMPAGAVAARELTFGTNAALTAAWNVLCAFQMAYLAYLFFVGPIVAALWVYPMKQFRDALPSWIEGVCTVCFWSLFWNTAILLMACFKGVDASGTIMITALNFLATSSVKYAFDFAGLVKAAGQQAGKKAMEKGKHGARGASGSSGASGSTNAAGAIRGGGNVNSIPPNIYTNVQGTSEFTSSSTSRSESLMPSIQPSSLKTSVAGSFDFQMPPSALNNEQNLYTKNTSLGNYLVSRDLIDGNTVDSLKTRGGQVFAELLPMTQISSSRSVLDNSQSNLLSTQLTSLNGKIASTNSTLANQAMSYQSMSDQTMSSETTGSNLSSPQLLLAGESQMLNDRSIALKSQNGTMLLSTDGKTLLVPGVGNVGYESFALSQQGNAAYTLDDGRNLFFSKSDSGSREISINDPLGSIEHFSVSATTGGYRIERGITGGASTSSDVMTNGNATIYTNYDQNGKLTDRDTIVGNVITSQYFDPNSTSYSPIGTAVKTFDAQGNYRTLYRDASGVDVASAVHAVAPNGGFIDTVYDQNGAVVSRQTATPQTNGFKVETARYKEGICEGVETTDVRKLSQAGNLEQRFVNQSETLKPGEQLQVTAGFENSPIVA